MDNALLSGQIAKCRKERGVTQEELGRAVGVSTQAVSRWESCSVSPTGPWRTPNAAAGILRGLCNACPARSA